MTARTAPVRVRRLAAQLRAESPDRDLLREFVQSRSHPAFAELVRRHAPLVFGVCRRALRHTQDAEDAFQATFLVLARRAARITAPEKLPGWLHCVAVRTAVEIRHMRDRRKLTSRDREGVGEPTSRDRTVDSAEQRELAAALDAELAKLPDHYRLPVLLCELRGLSRKQAAAELKIAEGTLSSRLAKARKVLAERLTKRGFAASAAAVTAALASTASARVPDFLQISATDIALGTASQLFSTSVISISDTVVKAMIATKLKSAVVAGGLLVALAGGMLLAPGGAGAQPGAHSGDGAGVKAKTDPTAELVKQLGSKEFSEREAAEKELRKLGAAALPAVKTGLKSDVPEVAVRSAKLLAAFRKDEVDRFVKAFRADTEFKQKFDHPIWTRWAKVVGDDHGSRELLGEVLNVPDSGGILDALSDGGAGNVELYKTQVAKFRAVAKKRAETPVNGRTHQEFQGYLIGEAAFVMYVATFPETGAAFGKEYEPGVVDAWMSLAALPLVRPGTEWHPRNGKSDPISKDEQAACARMKPAANKLLVAALLPQANPWAVVLGLHYYEGDKADFLPLAKAVCRDKTRTPAVRATVLPLLARFGETDYLPDMAALQTDRSQVQNMVERNGRDVHFILACDVAIASQLLMHKQDLKDYGFPTVIERQKNSELPDGWQHNASVHGFTDKAARTAAHEKALAFLKDAPKPQPKKDEPASALKRADHPLWKRFAAITGDTKEARELYETMVADPKRAEQLAAAEADPKQAGKVYQAEVNRVLGQLVEAREKSGAGEVSRGDFAYLLLLGSYPTAKGVAFAGERDSARQSLRHGYVFSDGVVAERRLAKTRLQPAGPTLVPTVVRHLYAAWFANRRDAAAVEVGVQACVEHQIAEALPAARMIAADVKADARARVQALWVVAAFGTKEDSSLVAGLFDSQEVFSNTTLTVGKPGDNEKDVIITTQARDVAYGVALVMHGKKPSDYGFTHATTDGASTQYGSIQLQCRLLGFETDKDRTAAHEQVIAFLKSVTAKEADPEKLVKQLGSKDFAEREAAEKGLKELGAKAYAAVKAGVKSDVPEVAERCAKLLPAVRAAWLMRPESTVWQAFAKIAGDTKEARALFADMVNDADRAALLEAVVAKPDEAGKLYRDELNRGIKALREGYDEAERRNRGRTGLNHPVSGVPTSGQMAALLFLGTFPATADETADVDVQWRDGLYANLFSYGLSPPGGDRKELTTPVRKLFAVWLAVRRDPAAVQHGLSLAKSHGIEEALPVARSVAADKSYATAERAAALLAVGLFGEAADVKLAEPLFDCTDDFHRTNYTYEGGRQVALVTQVRDAAYGVALKLHGQEPIDYGFEMCAEYKAGGGVALQARYYFGFRSDDARTAAHEKAKAFLKNAPIPKAKPAVPKKLDKVPDPSPELQKELFQFDETYRHGTPEQFAELEKKADELAKQYKEKGDQARIWYQVAHVAAQSDIRKQVERVKKYAPKCLEISRDPIHRATLYSYLASTEELAGGAFADRRRKAAEWLLAGYAELLAQELPDEKPELPAVEKLGEVIANGGPEAAQARAKHAAQMAARKEAEFVRDQVFHRDVLVMQFRDLYKPNPKQVNRDEKGPDELKALAAKIAAAVK